MRSRSTRHGHAVAGVLLVGLTGCVSAENSARGAEGREAAGLRPERRRLSGGKVRAAFVGRTRVTSAGLLGSQVTYMSPAGRSYLWFPGNRVVLAGGWTIEETGGYRPYAGKPVSQMSVCFRYGANTENAFSGQRGGTECIPAEAGIGLIQDSADGDIFGLSRTEVAPFVLPARRTTIRELQGRLAGGVVVRSGATASATPPRGL